MEKIEIKLQNCYGIKKLEYTFNFSDNKKTYSIYAPNGVMKTSLAKTFKDYSEGVKPVDLIYPDRDSTCSIKKNGQNIDKKQIFVIDPYNNKDFISEKMPTLLVNKKLKTEYDAIHVKIDKEKDRFLQELKGLSGLPNGIKIEEEILKAFSSNKKDKKEALFYLLKSIREKVLKNTESNLLDISYKEIFTSKKVIEHLEKKDFKQKLSEYIKKYDELIKTSKYFKEGVFNHNNAATIAISLEKNGFFKAEHLVCLNPKKEGKKEIHTKEELEQVIEQEKDAILSDSKLKEAFDEINVKLNAREDLRKFRKYLSAHKKIIPELQKLGEFRQKLWIEYFKNKKDFYNNLIKEYQQVENRLKEIIKRARAEKTHWAKVIEIFKGRFIVPFGLTIEDEKDAVLKEDMPTIVFTFEKEVVEKERLLKVLSSGEKRALYILNIIFEVRARQEKNQKTFFIIDDIVDSFDYKNKYAIIEYLQEISEENIFYQLILTHNFDFFRSIVRKDIVSYGKCLYSFKTKDEITFSKEGEIDWIKNPFINDWKKHLDNPKKLIASIPFIRNIIEYTNDINKGDTKNIERNKYLGHYQKLTSLLHWKDNSRSLSIKELKAIFVGTIRGLKFSGTNPGQEPAPNDKVVNIIFKEADNCLMEPESSNLENKIILSIAIRLKAEKFMIKKINDPKFVSEIKFRQYKKLLKRYEDDNLTKTDEIKILKEARLIITENIHLNSFMYEPILDISNLRLQNLYERISNLK